MERLDFFESQMHITCNNDASDDCIQLHFVMNGCAHCMNRNKTESMEKSLIRLAKTLSKPQSDSKKKKKSTNKIENVGPRAVIYRGETIPIETLLNIDWKDDMEIHIDDRRFIVVLNSPRISAISVFPRKRLAANSRIVPCVTVEHADSSLTINHWYIKSPSEDKYTFISSDPEFVPSSREVGSCLRLCSVHRRISKELSKSVDLLFMISQRE